MTTRVRDTGEQALIREFAATVPPAAGAVTGIGDDAAALAPPPAGSLLLVTTDMLVEGTHFDRASATPYGIGWKALGCSLSDIAAMGGLPRAAFVSLGLPGDTETEFVRELYRGIGDLAARFDCGVAGGDTVGSRRGLIVSVTVTGEVERERLSLRSGARPGDGLWVTGMLGGSLAGRHLSFTPRVREARFLTERFRVTAMMDLSDGLGSDLRRLAEASGAGFRLDASRIPIHPDADRGDPLRGALYDGEDFELLVAIDAAAEDRKLEREFSERFDCGIRRIGTAVPGKDGVTLEIGGAARPLTEGGYDHFR